MSRGRRGGFGPPLPSSLEVSSGGGGRFPAPAVPPRSAPLPTNKVWSSRQGARASWPQARAFTAAPGPPRPRCSGRRTRARPGPRCGGRRVTASPGWAPPRARSWPPAWRTTVSARSCRRGASGTSWRLIDVSVSPAVAPAVRGRPGRVRHRQPLGELPVPLPQPVGRLCRPRPDGRPGDISSRRAPAHDRRRAPLGASPLPRGNSDWRACVRERRARLCHWGRGPAATSKRCPLDQIWATSDGGSSWRAVPGTCGGYQLTSLDFPTATTGFTAGGQYLKYSGYAQELAVLKTTDAGHHWSWACRVPSPAPSRWTSTPLARSPS